MPNVKGTTRAQTIFLRAYAKNPDGPPADLWPSPAVFRKWLRRPRFAKALQSLLDAIRYQTDLHLAHAACNTAKQLAQATACPEPVEGPAPNSSNGPAPNSSNGPAPNSSNGPAPNSSKGQNTALNPQHLSLLLRLHHLRQRFPAHPAHNGKPRDDDDDGQNVISEREFIRSISGDEGVKDYDELVAMRRARAERERREREQAQSQTPRPPPTADEDQDDQVQDPSPTL
jgi:hypothetical protein